MKTYETRLPLRALALPFLFLVSACQAGGAAPADSDELDRWEQRAQEVTITRDDWGIAHVRGPTDADAVFGMIYAQAEDDFNRVETNYLNSMGRLAEAEGEGEIYRDLRMKLFIDPDSMQAMYARSPDWLRTLMDAWADGLNYYLHTHPEVEPRVIQRFEPWMALSFSEGSIGGDIERVNLNRLEDFYGDPALALAGGGAEDDPFDREPRGSNGIAIAPENSADGDALLLINPHTSFFFRSELQMTSEEGLNAYGAVTWGQFFLYQGFNERAGWMHTSSNLDVIDEFVETVVERDGQYSYVYGEEERPITTSEITVSYRTGAGQMAERTFTVYHTHRGPIVREEDGQWVSVALMNRPIEALSQSFLRTKAESFAEYMEVAELKANSSNNTIYADADGVIAYLHPQFVPRRDTRFDYSQPVDGSDPATDWQELHELDELPFVQNPPNGWIQNTNNHPYSAAGPYSPQRDDFPFYMNPGGENLRGEHAVELLSERGKFTLEDLREAAFDPYLPYFARAIPPLVAAHDALDPSDARRAELTEPIEQLRGWDHRWAAESVPTALAVYWGEALRDLVRADAQQAGGSVYDYMAEQASDGQRIEALASAMATLEADFGDWRTPWGEINRFQRLTGDISQPFNDDEPSIPVGFTSAQWGSLASFGARTYPGTVRRYGTSGNSFVAVVEFGDSVQAVAVTAGGESGDPSSPHFNDQAVRYATGDLREVYFYPSQLEGHTEREYHPGQ
ncbi:MAG: penicillin acylase family protein [Gemmatimonadota bacterium]